MASVRAIAARRYEVVSRLSEHKATLRDRFGITVEEQPVTNRDAELAQVQQLENVAAILGSIIEVAVAPSELAESHQLTEDATQRVADAERERDSARELLEKANEQIVELNKQIAGLKTPALEPVSDSQPVSVVPATPDPREPAENDSVSLGEFSDSLKGKLIAAGMVTPEQLQTVSDDELRQAGLVPSQVEKFRSVYPSA